MLTGTILNKTNLVFLQNSTTNSSFSENQRTVIKAFYICQFLLSIKFIKDKATMSVMWRYFSAAKCKWPYLGTVNSWQFKTREVHRSEGKAPFIIYVLPSKSKLDLYSNRYICRQKSDSTSQSDIVTPASRSLRHDDAHVHRRRLRHLPLYSLHHQHLRMHSGEQPQLRYRERTICTSFSRDLQGLRSIEIPTPRIPKPTA